MIIFKMFKNHPEYHFLNIFGPFFGPKSGFEEKNCKKKWRGPLAIKTKKSQIIYLF